MRVNSKALEDFNNDDSVTPKRHSSKQIKQSLEEYRSQFLQVPKIVNGKPIFISDELREQLYNLTKRMGGRKMSPSGFVENLVRHHMELYREDLERWQKL